MKTLLCRTHSGNNPLIRLTYAVVLLLLMSTLWSCNQNDAVAPSSVDATTLKNMRASFNALEGEWLLTTYQKAPLPAALQNKATLILTKKSEDVLQAGGRSFVNWYGGTFRLDETKGLVVSAEPLIQTLMAGSEEQMRAEQYHMDGLQTVKSFELTTNGQLKLYLGDRASTDTEVMIYTKK